MAARTDYSGPVLFSFGFRPFFLGACLFALAAIPAWLLIWRGTLDYSGPFLPTDWHIHEMLFGYGAAVVAGFLFTAVPNWTGRMPARGWPLALLSGLWLLGRLAAAGWLGLPALGVMAVDCAFLVAVITMIAREIIAGENWRNLKVLVPVTLLGIANACFHIEAMTEGAADVSRRLGIAVLIFMLAPMIGLNMVAGRRMKKMSEQLPDALQIVCRSLEAGHPVATAVSLVAREMPDPIGTEFGMAADEVSYGMSLTNAVQRMAERAGDPDVELFVATVRLQEKTGGNLCELLKANTTTIRERQTMRLKVKAASSEGRASAMILTSAPFIVMSGIHVLRPEFYGDVMDEPLVRVVFPVLFIWMAIGNFVMRKMINFKM